MAFNDGFYWYKNVLTKQLKLVLRIYLSIAIILSPIYLLNNAYAGAAEKWTIEEVVYDNVGKNLSYQASRPNAFARNDYTYKANVGVTAARTGSTVANMVRMGVAGAAIYGILEGVGWIIDQGKIVRKVEEDSGSNPTITNCYSALSMCVSSPEVLAQLVAPKLGGKSFNLNKADKYIQIYKNADKSHLLQVVTYTYITNPDYNPDFKNEEVPEPEVGAAVNNSPVAPSVLPDIYHPNNPAGGEAPKASDDALDNAVPEPRTDPNIDIKNKPNTDTDGDTVPDVYDPEAPSEGYEFELPKFCSWAATVCDWYIKYKEDSKKAEKHREDEKAVWQKIEDWFDWTKDDSDLPEKDNPLDIPDLDISADQINLSASGSCPQDSVSFSVMGNSVTLDMPYQPVCDALNFFKPAVLLVGAVASVYIVAGVRTKEEYQP